MLLNYLRRLSGHRRTRSANRQLGALLALIAGAVNAGGFLAVHQYTSHMTGFVSAIADNLVLGNLLLVLGGVGSLIAFLCGASAASVMISWSRHRGLHSEYALPLVVEAFLLLQFGLLGANLHAFVAITLPATVLLLCFIMGLQNALATQLSNAEIRTTHVTGVITDLGIEFGKMLYWNRSNQPHAEGHIHADRDKLLTLIAILLMFFIGCLIGAIGFKIFGFSAVLPFAALLVLVALVPVLDDVIALSRQKLRDR
ncbi:MAG: YoaK family protein [Oxalicibacterium faecigallinarum]|uniref:YoaK family protein n=1 Tax=Oxalicibacterium faecigallinarum TaxID=573741 RepID=UPI002809E073|nr:YoaK family protein [Oxalicibacterium faecigallinarum]MDQ7968311.1 YoaK family protein [Oxalicibacterium faecigallinarum]